MSVSILLSWPSLQFILIPYIIKMYVQKIVIFGVYSPVLLFFHFSFLEFYSYSNIFRIKFHCPILFSLTLGISIYTFRLNFFLLSSFFYLISIFCRTFYINAFSFLSVILFLVGQHYSMFLVSSAQLRSISISKSTYSEYSDGHQHVCWKASCYLLHVQQNVGPEGSTYGAVEL